MIADFSNQSGQYLGDCPDFSGMGYVADFMGWDNDDVDLYGAVSDLYNDADTLGMISDFNIEPELLGEIAAMTDEEIMSELPELMGRRGRRVFGRIRARRAKRRVRRGLPPMTRRGRMRRRRRRAGMAFAPLSVRIASLFGRRRRRRRARRRARRQGRVARRIPSAIMPASAGRPAMPIEAVAL